MRFSNKKRGATLAYVIVVLAIVSVIGTAIVSLSLVNYKTTILETKRTENLYMSESGLDEVEAYIENITKKAVKIGNDSVMNNLSLVNLTNEQIKEKGNEIFKPKYKEYVKSELIKSFDERDDNIVFNNDLLKTEKADNYTISLIDLNGHKLTSEEKTDTYIDGNMDFKEVKDKGEILSLRFQSKFKVKNKSYRNVSLTFDIKVPDFSGVTYKETVPIYNVMTKGLIVGENINLTNQHSIMNVDGGIIAAANLGKDDRFKAYAPKNPNDNEDYIVGINIGNESQLNVYNGSLISKQNIMLSENSAKLNVGKDGDEDSKYGVYTGNLGIYSQVSKEESLDGKVFGKGVINGGNIVSKYPVYTHNDLILNGQDSNIMLEDGFYGLNDITNSDEKTGKRESSSAIIINSMDIGNGSQIKIDKKAVIMGTAYINTKGTQYQTGESVATKGNYIAYTYDDGSGVTFKYYDPLQLVDSRNGSKLTLDDKVKYFKEMANTHDEINKNGVILPSPENTLSVGAVFSNGKVMMNTASMLDSTKEVVDMKDKFNKVLNEIKPLNEILNTNKNITKFDEDGNLVYVNFSNPNDDNGRERLDITREDGDNKNEFETFNGDKAAWVRIKDGKGKGIIITDRNIYINDDIDFEGTIITTGSIFVGSGKKFNVKYDDGIVSNIISDNQDIFKGLFKENSSSTSIVRKYDNNIENTTKSLVNRKNWEVN
ncbi:type II secretion system protein [Clostridium sp.]|uniref:type II secretion system protein n=1 Tax=Clostridium sp. TaxID=1506 RepID=UPI00262D35C8|nr:type II secretion system protein [Clostridium sp.]